MKFHNGASGLAIGLAAALFGNAAHAQNSNDEAPQVSADRVIIGMGAAVVPVYQGADDYRVLPLPALDIVSGPFFANLRDGIGAKAIETRDFTIGASIALTPGYRRRDVPDGVRGVDFGAGARIFGSFRAGGAMATIGGTQGFVGGTGGVTVDASLAYPVPVSPRLTLVPAAVVTWGDRKNNDRYFGITAREAQASGLSQFRAGSGFKDASANVTLVYRLTNRLSASATAGVTTLLGDVKDSPLVEKKTQPTGFFSLTYRMGKLW
ncbi:MipA/OmpV family protein [Novosphingobium sp. TCA1]|uniref:MipA/OmpV family protein n=1 Tax=Novosphingobium sp. TCA1 TaxID=2682474 RepID=UPI001307F8EE|nr:MipA/OmpV family protein [Novosphingobium sp. TCA1]GFE76002.1 putative outer membrane protein [Novosphingobium sp. TCA1]